MVTNDVVRLLEAERDRLDALIIQHTTDKDTLDQAIKVLKGDKPVEKGKDGGRMNIKDAAWHIMATKPDHHWKPRELAAHMEILNHEGALNCRSNNFLQLTYSAVSQLYKDGLVGKTGSVNDGRGVEYQLSA